MTEEQPEQVSVNVVWVGVEEMPITFVNQMLGQVDDHGDIIVTFGQVAPPLTLGTPEEQRAQIAQVPFVQVRPVARLHLPASRVEDIINGLRETLKNHQRVVDYRAQLGANE